jgi:Fe2+ transport system protein FeoA
MNPRPILLTSLPAGHTARLHETQLDPQSVGLLRALGLCEAECFRLCKAGGPCILQVGATRIGVSRTVASKILVIPDARQASAHQ